MCLVALQLTVVVRNVDVAVEHPLLVIGIDVCVELLSYPDHLLFLGVDLFHMNFPLDDSSVSVGIFHLEI